jgi:hypothetical protein
MLDLSEEVDRDIEQLRRLVDAFVLVQHELESDYFSAPRRFIFHCLTIRRRIEEFAEVERHAVAESLRSTVLARQGRD